MPSQGRSGAARRVLIGNDMSMQTILIILVIVLLLGGGGFFFRGRR